MPTKKGPNKWHFFCSMASLGTHTVMSYTHLPTHTWKPWFLGCLSRGLRETMTWGHLTVMEPFVRGNSHFPASPFTKQSMWTGAMVKDVWRRSDSVMCVCWVCEDSAVVIQMFCCRKGIWEENERWALMGSKGRSGIIGFDYICLSEQGRLNGMLELFWHCRRASKFLGIQNGKKQAGIVALSSTSQPCGARNSFQLLLS